MREETAQCLSEGHRFAHDGRWHTVSHSEGKRGVKPQEGGIRYRDTEALRRRAYTRASTVKG